MKINSIELYNFGSYEGETHFNTQVTNKRNIILVGGKNGAGKTTLFTAMRVCLYGYISMGYKSQNSYYKRAITKLINNNAKMTRPTDAYVQMEIQLSNGRGVDIYRLHRSWVLSDTLTEFYSVEKNNVALSADKVADFEKYILSLITPELFNLYFFDGEKIAEFFLNEGSNERIKEAFLTLCGYDTFDIMRRNFKRVKGNGQKTSSVLDEYLAAKDSADAAQKSFQELTNRLSVCVDEIGTCEADIDILEKAYSQKGGITEEEWNKKLAVLKEEEKKRDNWNVLLRKWANELVPFLMIRDQMQKLKRQIERENNNLKYRNFCEVLDAPDVTRLIETDIRIDSNFNTHIYRTEEFSPTKLVESIMAVPGDHVYEVIGEASMRELQHLAQTDTISGIITYCKAQQTNPIMLPVEIDKSSLSNGEKQIFIMALYHSLVQLCNYEIPFVIDTPFARIDTEHRRNISLHFFSELKGQVFILSTNEEINSDHIAIMKDHISKTYMLENNGSQKTEVLTDSYFEV